MDEYGKKFEACVRADLLKLDHVWVHRLADQMSGFAYNSRNLCDFICFWRSKLFLLECKVCKNKKYYLSNFRQYDILSGIEKQEIPNLKIGVIIWFNTFDKIIYVPVSEMIKMKEDNVKSIDITDCLNESKYNIVEIPTSKKKIFFNCDFSFLDEV